MNADVIFDLYTKMIEEDFAHNQEQYSKKKNNDASAVIEGTKKYEVELENNKTIIFPPGRDSEDLANDPG